MKIFNRVVILAVMLLGALATNRAMAQHMMHFHHAMGNNGGMNYWQMRLTDENAVNFRFKIEDQAGAPMGGVSVMCYQNKDGLIFGATSNKKGEVDIRVMKDKEYILDVSMPGYEKLSVIYPVKDEDIELEEVVKMKESVEGVAQMKGKPLTVNCQYFARMVGITVNRHEAFEGKSVADVLKILPGVDLNEQGLAVLQNSNYKLKVNKDLLKVPAQALLRYLGSIDASALRTVTIVWADSENGGETEITLDIKE